MLLSKFSSHYSIPLPWKEGPCRKTSQAETGRVCNGKQGRDHKNVSYQQPESQCWKVNVRLVFASLDFSKVRGKVIAVTSITLWYVDETKIQLCNNTYFHDQKFSLNCFCFELHNVLENCNVPIIYSETFMSTFDQKHWSSGEYSEINVTVFVN